MNPSDDVLLKELIKYPQLAASAKHAEVAVRAFTEALQRRQQPASVPAELVRQWLDEWGNSGTESAICFIANRAAAYGREQAQQIPAWYGMDTPWPLHEILAELSRAAGILLDDKSYDGCGHEFIRNAQTAADAMLAMLQQLPEPPTCVTTGGGEVIKRYRGL